jgi:NitT/TauT family transport system substrate-binding protein
MVFPHRCSWWAPVVGALLACSPATSSPPAPAAIPAASPATPGPAAGAAGAESGAGAGSRDGAIAAGSPVPPIRSLELPTATLSATSTPLWVGVDQGMFRRYGFDVQVTGLAPAAATQAVQSGTVPFAATAGSTISAFVSGARDLRYVAGLVNRVPFQLVGQPDVARIEALRDKAVATSTPGSSTSIALADILSRHGLEPDRDVAILYLRDQPGILTGLVGGQAAAGFLASPFNRQALNQGFRLLLDTVEAGIDILGLNITTTTDVLQREPDAVRRFLMAYVEAVQFARHQREPTIESIMQGTRNDSRDLAEGSYDLYRTIWDVWPAPGAIAALLNDLDLPGARDVRPEQMLDLGIMRELEASGWLAQHITPP